LYATKTEVLNTEDKKLPNFAQKELDKANDFWGKFVTVLNKSNNEPRIVAILFQVMFEYYIDKILVMLSKPKDLKFDQKLVILKNSNILGDDYVCTFEVLYDIRNIYAHEIQIYEKRLKDKLNSITHNHDLDEFKKLDSAQHYFKLADSHRMGLQRAFLDELIKKIENHENNDLDDKFSKMFQ
jgi:hypothetical protein